MWIIVIFVLQVCVKADRCLLIQSLLDNILQIRECPSTDKQNISGIYRYHRNHGIFAVGSDRHLYLTSLQKLQKSQKHPSHNLILLTEIGHGAFAHSSGNLNHLRSSLTLFHHLTMEIPGKAKRQNGSGRYQPEKQLVHSINRIKRLNESLKVLI